MLVACRHLSALSMMPVAAGLAGYVGPMVVLTVGHARFQTANISALMSTIRPGQRGVRSAMPNLSRNLAPITGASVMGMVLAIGAASTDLTMARPETIAAGMRTTSGVAATLIAAALGVALRTRAAGRRRRPND
jgi:hypothetical protein